MGMFDGWRANGSGNNNSNGNGNGSGGGNNNGNGNDGGNGNGNSQGNGNGGNGGNNDGGGNNNKNSTDLTVGLWDNPVDKNANGGGNNNNNNNNGNNNNQNNNNGNKPVTFDDYVAGLDFGTQFKQEHVDKLKTGDTSVLPEMFAEIQKSTYKKAMMDVNQLVAAKVKEGVNEALTQANGARNIEKVVDKMNTDLEFTKDPLIAPVAKTILGRALNKGMSQDDAVKAVGQYFKRVAGAANNLLDDDDGGGNMAGRENYGGRRGEEPTDFVALLSGQE